MNIVVNEDIKSPHLNIHDSFTLSHPLEREDLSTIAAKITSVN